MRKLDSGQSMFELVLAIGIMGIILLSLVALATLSVRNASFSRNQAEASRLGQETIEWLRHERDTSWSTFVTNTTASPTRCVVTPEWSGAKLGGCTGADIINGLYFRRAEFTPTDINSDTYIDRIEVVVIVSWQDARGNHEVANSIYYTNWE